MKQTSYQLSHNTSSYCLQNVSQDTMKKLTFFFKGPTCLVYYISKQAMSWVESTWHRICGQAVVQLSSPASCYHKLLMANVKYAHNNLPWCNHIAVDTPLAYGYWKKNSSEEAIKATPTLDGYFKIEIFLSLFKTHILLTSLASTSINGTHINKRHPKDRVNIEKNH